MIGESEARLRLAFGRDRGMGRGARGCIRVDGVRLGSAFAEFAFMDLRSVNDDLARRHEP
jgi:hypothetical protein